MDLSIQIILNMKSKQKKERNSSFWEKINRVTPTHIFGFADFQSRSPPAEFGGTKLKAKRMGKDGR